jgi:hypothetical protein
MRGFIQCGTLEVKRETSAELKIWVNETISVAIICAKLKLFLAHVFASQSVLSSKVNMIPRYILTDCVHVAVVTFILFSSSVFAASDAYLDALSSEAEDSAHVSSSQQKAGPSENERLVKLEAFLLKEKPTTFKYYEKLSSTDKVTVLVLYESSHADKKETLAELRKKVLDLYFKR